MDLNQLYEVYWLYRRRAIADRLEKHCLDRVLTFEEWLDSQGYIVEEE